MMEWSVNPDWIRAGAFVVALLGLLTWERIAPRRRPTALARRWFGNMGLLLSGTLFVRIVLPIVPVGVALWAQTQGLGLLNLVAIPPWLSVVAGVMILDFAIYWQHRAMHAVPLLWRLHRVHHADTGFDVTTALRFHPLEIGLSLLYKFAVIVLFGASPIAVFVFELLLNISAMFNHSNIRLPESVDRVLRRVLVTPDFHRVHHSSRESETNQNFGFCLTLWDYLFGSYTAQPRSAHEQMEIGLSEFRRDSENGLVALLTQPFRRPN
ncbi:MAG: sterol desaturase family protein [Pseudomonadota bacterium]